MNWGGFPVGFRFSVTDFSLETKRRCWSYVLPALTYADLTDSTLREAESAELFDPDRLIYIAIVSPKVVTLSRKNSLLWRTDGRLMSALALYTPIVMENFLELYTNTRILADITVDRRVEIREGGEGLFPERIEAKIKCPFRQRALILPRGELPFNERMSLCREAMEKLYSQDDSLYLKMLPLSAGGEGTVQTAAAFLHGRIFTELVPSASGEKRRCLFGVTPGRRLLIEGATVPDIGDALDESFGLGRCLKAARERGFTDMYLFADKKRIETNEVRLLKDIDEIYHLSSNLSLYDQVILVQRSRNGRIETEALNIDRRDKACVSWILSKRNEMAAS